MLGKTWWWFGGVRNSRWWLHDSVPGSYTFQDVLKIWYIRTILFTMCSDILLYKILYSDKLSFLCLNFMDMGVRWDGAWHDPWLIPRSHKVYSCLADSLREYFLQIRMQASHYKWYSNGIKRNTFTYIVGFWLIWMNVIVTGDHT